MILFHCSTVKIDNFYIPYGGLHFGGINSALEAALRKLRSPMNVVNADTVYLHKCIVDLGIITFCDDLGGDDSWRSVIDECQRLGFNSVQYKNLYEPDSVPSYMIWESNRVKILEVDPIHMDDAEDIIEEYLSSISTDNILGSKVY